MGRLWEVKHVDGNLWRSNRPVDLHAVQKLGFKTIIDLQSGTHELFTNELIEQQFPNDYGISYYDLKCSDFTPPKPWQVLKFLEVVSRGEKTMVHCMSGVDRTGFMCAVYRMKVLKWSYNKALEEWKAQGRHFWYFYWERELKKWM